LLSSSGHQTYFLPQFCVLLMQHRVCKQQTCEFCGEQLTLLWVRGFGVLRRWHARKCWFEQARQQALTQTQAPSAVSFEQASRPVCDENNEGASSSSSSSAAPGRPQESTCPAAAAETSWRFYPFGTLRKVLHCGRRNRPQHKEAVPAPGDPPQGRLRPDEMSATAYPAVPRKESSLLTHLRVSAALEKAAADQLEGCSHLEKVWLRDLAEKAATARQSVQAPPTGEGWSAPIECSNGQWSLQLWYRWSSRTVIESVSRLAVPGSFYEVLSLFREADLATNWLPFVSDGDCTFSSDVPALLTSMRIKLPLIPYSLRTVIHRAFIDAFHTSTSPGICIVEWTPQEIETSGYCGMTAPPSPPRCSQMQVQLATTMVCSEPDEENRCIVIMANQNDFKVNNRLIPDLALRKFLSVNSRVVASNITACLEDPKKFGYHERIQNDAQGFYSAVRRSKQEPQSL